MFFNWFYLVGYFLLFSSVEEDLLIIFVKKGSNKDYYCLILHSLHIKPFVVRLRVSENLWQFKHLNILFPKQFLQ